MTDRAVASNHIDEIVRSAAEFASRQQPDVCKQATRAAATLRIEDADALFELLERDLPRTINQSNEWEKFRRAAIGPLQRVNELAGVPGMALWLSWVGRLAKIKRARSGQPVGREPKTSPPGRGRRARR